MLKYDKKNNVKFRRIYNGWTRKELSLKSGISISTIINIEKKNKSISAKIALKLAEVFGINVNQLFDE